MKSENHNENVAQEIEHFCNWLANQVLTRDQRIQIARALEQAMGGR